MNNYYTVDIGGGFFTLLGILFITLKLIGIIDWSWWIILAPIWIPFVLLIGFIIFILIWESC